jgi:hypothetical protein
MENYVVLLPKNKNMEGKYRSRNLEASFRSEKTSTVLTALFELKDSQGI